MESSLSSSFHPNNNGQIPSQTTDTTSMNSVHASEHEDAESGVFILANIAQFLSNGQDSGANFFLLLNIFVDGEGIFFVCYLNN